MEGFPMNDKERVREFIQIKRQNKANMQNQREKEMYRQVESAKEEIRRSLGIKSLEDNELVQLIRETVSRSCESKEILDEVERLLLFRF